MRYEKFAIGILFLKELVSTFFNDYLKKKNYLNEGNFLVIAIIYSNLKLSFDILKLIR